MTIHEIKITIWLIVHNINANYKIHKFTKEKIFYLSQ